MVDEPVKSEIPATEPSASAVRETDDPVAADVVETVVDDASSDSAVADSPSGDEASPVDDSSDEVMSSAAEVEDNVTVVDAGDGDSGSDGPVADDDDSDDDSDDDDSDDDDSDDDDSDDDDIESDQDDNMDVEPLELIEEADDDELKHNWYILKVQVNRENSICEALQRRVKVEGLERFFGDILVPTEDVREFTKTGKQRVVKRKLYPGYIVVNMAINDDTWFLVRETPGIGDFTGSIGKPTPMLQHEIDRILVATRPDEEEGSPEKTNIRFKQGDRVRVKEGHFQNFEGEVDTIDETHGRVTVMINIFGRPTPVELEHWQVEDV